MRDNSTKSPLYYQLFDSLVEYIQKDLQPHDQLPTEKEIGTDYSVSRTTVRLAMQELEKHGYIYRIQGKGSFVSSLKQENINSFFSLELKNHYDGLETADFESHLVSFTKENGSLALKHLFGLSKQTNLVRIQLEHLLHSELVATETIVAKASYMPELTQESLEFEGLDSLFQKTGAITKAVDEHYSLARFMPTSSEIDALKITKSIFNQDNELMLTSTRIINIQKLPYRNFIWTN
ncbi:TPA: GntR family transcriptional regulator [Streptococcus suis]|uniref:GntR family transcriptional regulator n=4 Tax=Streptococcus suis TaxID=1307 RepID=A0A7Y6RR10_STRSU|nr:GntR family transcriptional regulator [Streptococcus suis]AHF59467.1 putative transcriptional regulator of N-Acetylglucosamine utilization, GntR family [Streptococcus suis 05HAS68]ALA29556.1 hypothetical protein AA105_10065 [Streptococcus suis]AMU79816.1 hypothetical protein AN924_13640 [Streptococcus suis]AUW26807.1 GntR family transcriptional regulator [Streptococcus suis]KPA57199.1 hypothetical protein XK22_05765 [Streptococcus suis]